MALDPQDAWHVQFKGGEVRVVSLDELDEAFQSGLIDENTQVFAPGATTWQTLGDAAGLGGGDAAEDASASAEPPLEPLTVDPAKPLSLARMPAEPSMPLSLAPLAFDLAGGPSEEPSLAAQLEDDDFLGASLKPKRGRAIGIAIGACAAIAALAFGVNVATAGATDAELTANAQSALVGPTAAAAPPASPVVEPAPAPPPAAEAPQPQAAATPPSTALSQQQKERLAEADHAIQAKLERHGHKGKTHAQPRAKAKVKRRAGAKHRAGVASGDKFDPLNGAL